MMKHFAVSDIMAASVAVNYDSLNSRFKVWNEAQEEYKTLNGQLSFFFWCRLVL